MGREPSGAGPRERGLGLNRARRAASLVLGFMLAAAGPAGSQESGDQLEAVERELRASRAAESSLEREAEELRAEVEALRARLIQSARAAQNRESEMTRLEARLETLDAERAEAHAALKARHGQLAVTLAALQRIALRPPEALIVLPERPVDTVRSALLLRAALPEIEARAAALREELDALARLGTDIAVRRRELAGAAAALEAEQDRLDTLLARKKTLVHQTEAERAAAAKRVARLVAQAKDLRELMARLGAEAARPEPAPDKPPAPAGPVEGQAEGRVEEAAEEPATGDAGAGDVEAGQQVASLPAAGLSAGRLTRPPGLRDFSEARGRVIRPARGELTARYGEDDGFGATTKGITIRTRPGAQVVAPFDGQIVFAGPFRRYGQILIIEHGGGYHTLVAGLARIDGIVGQWVLAGEPVGLMGNPETGESELYVELRRGGRPINPVPWLADERG